MTAIDILYLGDHNGTCRDRADAYRRNGHRVTHVDPRRLLPGSAWTDRIIWRLGGALLAPALIAALRPLLDGRRFDLAHVDGGECVSRSVIRLLRQHCAKVINYNIDDPFGGRDHRRFSAYLSALGDYDLAVVPRELNIPEAYAHGATNVLCVHRSADEVSHSPVPVTEADREEWASDILFLGTWMPERGPFLAELLELGVPLSIVGSGWHKAPEWPRLKGSWKRGAIAGADYAKAIQCAKVNLGLLSKGNRDLHTTRSLEIPALGGLLCAERTAEHLAMYDEGTEAVFWADARECARKCFEMLNDEPRRQRIAAAGRQRLARNGHYNQIVMRRILEFAGFGVERAAGAIAAEHGNAAFAA